MLIAVVALLVIGPERLPPLMRTAGLWLGKMRGFVSTVKRDIDRELAAEELKKTLARQAQMPELQTFVDEMKRDIAPPSGTSAETAAAPSTPPSTSPASGSEPTSPAEKTTHD